MGADQLDGGGGRDRLFGGKGVDRLAGGSGQDTLAGGTGSDVFVFSTNGDADLVKDFEDDIDSLDLREFGFSSVAEAKSYAKNDNGNAKACGCGAALRHRRESCAPFRQSWISDRG